MRTLWLEFLQFAMKMCGEEEATLLKAKELAGEGQAWLLRISSLAQPNHTKYNFPSYFGSFLRTWILAVYLGTNPFFLLQNQPDLEVVSVAYVL